MADEFPEVIGRVAALPRGLLEVERFVLLLPERLLQLDGGTFPGSGQAIPRSPILKVLRSRPPLARKFLGS